MFGIGEPGTLEPPGQEATTHVQNFLLVPLMLEKLVSFGIFVLLDAFLYVLTFLPIRVVFSFLLLMVEIFSFIWNSLLHIPLLASSKDKKQMHSRGVRFHRTHLYDLMRGMLLLLGYLSLLLLDMSKVYHYIRGQNVIKLYVLFSMMEIMDKLLR
jgi:hypothetical protein